MELEWTNYHHLRYFHAVAKEGNLTRAAARLNVSQPAVTVQIQALEESLGEKLFDRKGRGLELTEAGKIVFGYAEQIFALGDEMRQSLRGFTGRRKRLFIGVSDAVSKIIAYRILKPAFDHKDVAIVCREDQPQRLLAALALHDLDLALSDAPIPAGSNVRAYNHLLGESGVTMFATPKIARSLRRGFPHSLEGQPILMPGENSAIRRDLESWLESTGIALRVAGEFEDSALMKVFGQAGMGLFVAPTVIEKEIGRQYSVETVGRIGSIRSRFYLISPERRLRHPAIVSVSDQARSSIFARVEHARKS